MLICLTYECMMKKWNGPNGKNKGSERYKNNKKGGQQINEKIGTKCLKMVKWHILLTTLGQIGTKYDRDKQMLFAGWEHYLVFLSM